MNRRRRLSVAMLATAATLLGGGQALAPTPAVALVDDGGHFCSGASWFEQVSGVSCFDKTETGGGLIGKPADNGAGALGTASPDPDCLIEGVYCSEGTAPQKTCATPGYICVSVTPKDEPIPETGRDNGPPEQIGGYRGRPSCKGPGSRLERDVCPRTKVVGNTPKETVKCQDTLELGEYAEREIEMLQKKLDGLRGGGGSREARGAGEAILEEIKKEKRWLKRLETRWKDNHCRYETI